MKRLLQRPLLIGIVFVLAGVASSHTSTAYPPDSTHTIKGIPIYFEPDTSLGENAKRVAELREVLDVLPDHLFQPLGRVRVRVSGSPDLCRSAWASACTPAGVTPRIWIHQRSDADAYPFDWEHYATNGYTHLERVKILDHEFAHLIHRFVISSEQIEAFNAVRDNEPESPTRYGDTRWSEDWAEAFAFYVLWPDYLERYYPERYVFMYDLFGGIEYTPRDTIPSSIKDRLRYDWPLED